MMRVCLREKQFFQLAFQVGASDQRDLLRLEAFGRIRRRMGLRRQHQHRLI
jgi:hypothetical protein